MKKISWGRKAYAIVRGLFSIACVSIALNYYSTFRMMDAFKTLSAATMEMWRTTGGLRAFTHSTVPYLDALAACLLFLLVYGGITANAVEAVRIWQGKEVMF